MKLPALRVVAALKGMKKGYSRMEGEGFKKVSPAFKE